MTWHARFMDLATMVAGWSKDPSTQCGAVIIDSDRRVVGLGYNGFPRGVADLPERYGDREIKYKMVVHAEANAILNANRSVDGCMLYATKFPCTHCTKLIIQAGIRQVFSPVEDPNDPSVVRWAEEAKISKIMFRESKVWLCTVQDGEVVSAEDWLPY